MHRRNGWFYSFGLIGLLVASAVPGRAQLPAEYKFQDLGEPEQAGKVTVDDKGVWSVTAGGNDIWGGADQGFFVFKTQTGDGNITMRFVEKKDHDITTPAKSGPMMRASTEADAVSAFLPFQGDRLVDPHFRFEQGGASTNFEIEMRGHPPAPNTPLWQRLERQGTRVSGLISDDGRIWTSLVSVAMPNLPPEMLVGIGATKHSASGETPVTVVYDNVTTGTDLSPQNVVALARDRGALVMWNAIPGAEGYNVYTLADDRTSTRVTAEPTKNTSIELQNLENGKATTVVVAAVMAGKEGIGVQTLVTPGPAVAGGFQGVNINTLLPGSVSADANGVITMRGAGHVIGTLDNNIAGRSDGFYYLAMPASGNATATVRVVEGPSAEREDPNRQAGIMFRESLDQDARFVMMELTSESGARLQRRTEASAEAELTDAELSDAALRPVWLRVVRNGSTFTGFIAEDAEGKQFRQVGEPVTIEGFGDAAYVGIALSPRTGFGARPTDQIEFAEAKFDNLTVAK
jgi:hypothetical protein